MHEFGHMKGHGSQEIKWGLNKLTDQLRRVEYMKLSAHAPQIYSGLYEPANSIKEMEENDARNAGIIKRRIESLRADADDGTIFARQLEQIDPRRFEVKYRPLGMWRDIIPAVAVPTGLRKITYRVEDYRGEVEPVTVGRVEVPYVGISTEEFSNNVVTKGLGYRYTVDELEAAAFANVPLPDRYQRTVMKSYERNQDLAAFEGDSEEGLEGIINHTGVSNLQAALPASGSSRTWAGGDKTTDEIIADIAGMPTKVATQSEENYNEDRTNFVLLLPRVPYNALKKPRASFSDKSIIDFILSNRKYGIVDIKVKPQLSGQGTGSTDIAILMPQMDREVIEFHVSDSILWQPAQFVGLDVRFPSRQRHGGVVVRYPIAMTQLYGI